MEFIFSFLNVLSKYMMTKVIKHYKAKPGMVMVLLKVKIIIQKEYIYIVLKKNKITKILNDMIGM
jgi:nucleoside diphosphate kinase